MKKSLFFVFLFVFCFSLLFGCASNQEQSEIQDKILDGASMIIQDGTLTNKGAKITITDLNQEEIHTYGESFRLDIKKNGKWEVLKLLPGNYAFRTIGYEVNENHELEMDVQWAFMYGELQSGEYRLVKDAAISKNDSYLGSGVVYAEFTIQNYSKYIVN